MENSGFGEHTDFFALTDIVALNNTGATSDTFKVRINGKWHFLKRPKKEFANHPKYISAFEKEFEVGYTLEHSNIVRYVAKGNDKEGFYLLTEYVDGKTLKDFISENPTHFQKQENIQRFISQLLSAISYLHSKQILHLDLKPDNILITSIGNDVKIIDLGFAYTDCYQFLTTGKTNQFASPEQLNNGKIDQRTDIYGVGMLLLYIFTQNTDKKQLSNIPQPYRKIVKKCLGNIDVRYQNIQALKDDLQQNSNKKYLFITLLVIAIVGGSILYNKLIYNEIKNPIIENTEIILPKDSVQEKTNIEIKDTEISKVEKVDNSTKKFEEKFDDKEVRILKEAEAFFDSLRADIDTKFPLPPVVEKYTSELGNFPKKFPPAYEKQKTFSSKIDPQSKFSTEFSVKYEQLYFSYMKFLQERYKNYAEALDKNKIKLAEKVMAAMDSLMIVFNKKYPKENYFHDYEKRKEIERFYREVIDEYDYTYKYDVENDSRKYYGKFLNRYPLLKGFLGTTYDTTPYIEKYDAILENIEKKYQYPDD